MITKLDVQTSIQELTNQSASYFKDKLSKQRKGEYTGQEGQLIKKINSRLKELKTVMLVIDTMSETTLQYQRNQLIIKIRAIENREPLKPATEHEEERPYTIEEKKTKEIKAKIDKEFALYGYKKLKEQLKAINFILRN